MKTIQKFASLLLALCLCLCLTFAAAEEEPANILRLTGTGECLGMDGETLQPTAAWLELNLDMMTATVELTTEAVGMNFFLLSSVMSDDPNMAILYIQCALVGEGVVTETEDGYLVSFAWENEVMDEATGATQKIPMTMEIPVKAADEAYTAQVEYGGYAMEVSSAAQE